MPAVSTSPPIASACRTVPEELFLDGIEQLVSLEQDWIPTAPGTSLYIRPTMIAVEPVLGVHPSNHYYFFVILSPVGAYYAAGFNPVNILVEDHYVRAVPGGTGEAKTGGNYASSLKAGLEAKKKGYDQVLWLDGRERRYIEEVGAMNMFFAYGNTYRYRPAERLDPVRRHPRFGTEAGPDPGLYGGGTADRRERSDGRYPRRQGHRSLRQRHRRGHHPGRKALLQG